MFRFFLENLACFLQISVLGFAVLPYYQRIYETNLTNIDPAKVTRATFGSPISYSFRFQFCIFGDRDH